MKVLLVDDHTLVRRGLSRIIEAGFPDVEIAEASSVDEAIVRLGESVPDVALVDIRLPGRDGIELLREIKKSHPELPVIILTSFDEAKYARQALALGASGYILKDSTPEDLDQAIRVALTGGGNVLSTGVIQNLFEDLDSPASKSPADLADTLSKRELEILGYLVAGSSNREIAVSLGLSEKTIKAHLAAVYRKLDVGNRTQAAMIATSMGIERVLPTSSPKSPTPATS